MWTTSEYISFFDLLRNTENSQANSFRPLQLTEMIVHKLTSSLTQGGQVITTSY